MLSAKFYFPRMWRVAVGAGATVALLTLVAFPEPTSSAWPGTAAQIVPTLLIALALEGRLYADPAKARVGEPMSILALVVAAIAEIVALSAAAAGDSLTLGTAAIVHAAIAALTVAAILSPLVDPTHR